jgi:uncharacterized lipoprotein YmbA
MRPILAVVAACAGLVACGTSPPVQYFVLDSVHPVAPVVDGVEVPVRVSVVRIPPDLDRQEMVRESAATELTVSDQHRWGAPLGEMTARVLSQDLAQRLSPGMVVFPQEPAPPRVNNLVINVFQFDRDPSGAVTFDGSWSLVPDTADAPLVRRHVHLRLVTPSGSYGEQVRAMSHILAVLSDSIVANLPSATAAHTPTN